MRLLIGIKTSGNLKNVQNTMELANKMKIKTFGFLGAGGGKVFELCDEVSYVSGNEIGRIQEYHISAGHGLIEYIEDCLIEEKFIYLLRWILKRLMH